MPDRPRRLDKVYAESRIAKGLQPNGYVSHILYEDQQVIVKYYDEPFTVDSYVRYDMDDFEGTYNRSIGGGTWFIDGLGEKDEAQLTTIKGNKT